MQLHGHAVEKTHFSSRTTEISSYSGIINNSCFQYEGGQLVLKYSWLVFVDWGRSTGLWSAALELIDLLIGPRSGMVRGPSILTCGCEACEIILIVFIVIVNNCYIFNLHVWHFLSSTQIWILRACLYHYTMKDDQAGPKNDEVWVLLLPQ